MTQALSAAVATAAQLPEEEQDALAAILLEEMESEERWSTLFADSQNLLEQMAKEAIQDFQAGRVQPTRLASRWSAEGRHIDLVLGGITQS
jgi:hypothetical protein